MKILGPRDNALLMRHWWPTVRPAKLVPIIVLLAIALGVVLFGCYVSRSGRPGRGPEWFAIAFGIVVGIQSLVLLLVGSFCVGSAAYQEATTGAMDFHRASATSPLNQALGLVIGPGMLSWILAAVCLPVTLSLAILGAVTPGDYIAVQLSLVLTGVFFHVISSLIGLTARKGRLGLGQQAGSLAAAFFLICVSIPFSYSDWSLPGYLTSYPVIGLALGGAKEIRSAIVGVELPPLLIQAIVQCPLIALIGTALRRSVAYPNRPAVSKPLGLLLSVFLLAFFVASFYSGVVPFRQAHAPGVGELWRGAVAFALLFALVLGVVLVHLVTPRYVLYCNGLRRRHRLGLRWAGPLDDASGNSVWVAAFWILASAFYFSLSDTPAYLPVESLIAMLLYLGWFACATEYFRLTPERRRGAIFAVTIAVLWGLIPAFGFVAKATGERWPLWTIALLSPCPIFGVVAPLAGEPRHPDSPPQPLTTITVLVANVALLIVFASLARSARRKAAEKVIQHDAPHEAAQT